MGGCGVAAIVMDSMVPPKTRPATRPTPMWAAPPQGRLATQPIAIPRTAYSSPFPKVIKSGDTPSAPPPVAVRASSVPL